MSKELEQKQIGEMAKDLAKHSFFYNGGCLMNYSTTAKLLYEAGYRKQNEGYWTLKRPNCSYYCSCCGKGIKIKYGERAAILWDFCPNCGAKMKGGAE